MSINDLVARLEAATGPDQDIDADIWDFIGLTDGEAGHCAGWISQNGRDDLTRRDYLLAWAKRFTGSTDAAMTLIPPGWDVIEANSNGGLWGVRLGRGDIGNPAYREVWSWTGDSEREIFHRKPLALALCVVALKARRHD